MLTIPQRTSTMDEALFKRALHRALEIDRRIQDRRRLEAVAAHYEHERRLIDRRSTGALGEGRS